MAPSGAPPRGPTTHLATLVGVPLEELFAGLQAVAQKDGAPPTTQNNISAARPTEPRRGESSIVGADNNHSNQAEAAAQPAPERVVALAKPQPQAQKQALASPPKFAGIVPRRFAKAAAPAAPPPLPPPADARKAEDATATAGAAMSSVRSSLLPVHAHMAAILSAISRRRLTCIRGETGCGKSSEIPLAIIREALARGGDDARDVNVVVTQPRRLAARALAARVAWLLGEEVGETCGYRVGNGEGASGPKTRLLFVTSGWLLTRWGEFWGEG